MTLVRFSHSSWFLDALSLKADSNLQSAGFAVIHSFVSGCRIFNLWFNIMRLFGF